MEIEQTAKLIIIYVGQVMETLAAIVIAVAVINGVVKYVVNSLANRQALSTEKMRLQFGSAVAVSLELLLAADVLSTAVAPGWDAIGKLAAIAVIRTALNYFLGKELKQTPASTTDYSVTSPD